MSVVGGYWHHALQSKSQGTDIGDRAPRKQLGHNVKRLDKVTMTSLVCQDGDTEAHLNRRIRD